MVPAGKGDEKQLEMVTIFPDMPIEQVVLVKEAETIETFPREIVDGNVIVIVPPVGIGSIVVIEKS